jgi:hypothetical protein
MNTKFDQFIKEHIASLPAQAIDLETEKNLWLEKLDALYDLVERSLAPYLKPGSIRLNFRTIDLYEDQLGNYQVPSLDISVGRAIVKLNPIGTFLIGVRGRVDMNGPRGTARFVIAPSGSPTPTFPTAVPFLNRSPDAGLSEAWVWKISTPPPRITYIDLTEESFREALMGVVDG